MEDPYHASTSHKETSPRGQYSHRGTCSKNTQNHGESDSVDELKTKAIEVNSADEVRQAIKAVLSGKQQQIENEDPPLANKTSEEIQVSLSQEYKPESGDQLQVPKQDKTRKRRGRPQKAGPSKRVKKVTVEDFYVGKLSNVVRFPSFNSIHSGSESDSIYAPYAPNKWLRCVLCKEKTHYTNRDRR